MQPETMLYWISVLDNIKWISVLLCILAVIVTGITAMALCEEFFENEIKRKMRLLQKCAVVIGITSLLLAIFVPSQRTMLKMAEVRFARMDIGNVSD